MRTQEVGDATIEDISAGKKTRRSLKVTPDLHGWWTQWTLPRILLFYSGYSGHFHSNKLSSGPWPTPHWRRLQLRPFLPLRPMVLAISLSQLHRSGNRAIKAPLISMLLALKGEKPDQLPAPLSHLAPLLLHLLHFLHAFLEAFVAFRQVKLLTKAQTCQASTVNSILPLLFSILTPSTTPFSPDHRS